MFAQTRMILELELSIDERQDNALKMLENHYEKRKFVPDTYVETFSDHYLVHTTKLVKTQSMKFNSSKRINYGESIFDQIVAFERVLLELDGNNYQYTDDVLRAFSYLRGRAEESQRTFRTGYSESGPYVIFTSDWDPNIWIECRETGYKRGDLIVPYPPLFREPTADNWVLAFEDDNKQIQVWSKLAYVTGPSMWFDD